MKLLSWTFALAVGGSSLLPGQMSLAGGCGCERLPCPTVTHHHHYRHHHHCRAAAPPVGMLVPSAPMMAAPAMSYAPVMAAPPVQMVPVQMAPVQMAPVQMAPVQMAPVQMAPVPPQAPPAAAPTCNGSFASAEAIQQLAQAMMAAAQGGPANAAARLGAPEPPRDTESECCERIQQQLDRIEQRMARQAELLDSHHESIKYLLENAKRNGPGE